MATKKTDGGNEPGKKRIYKREKNSAYLVDRETGEILQEAHDEVEGAYVETEPQYIKVYLDCILRFKGVSSSLNPILLSLCKHMYYANHNQMVFVNKYIKDLICEECGVKVKRVEQAIKQFVEVGILRRHARGVYQVNPYIISRGHWEDVKKLRATFDFMTGSIELDTNIKNEDRAAEPEGQQAAGAAD